MSVALRIYTALVLVFLLAPMLVVLPPTKAGVM